VPNRNGAPDYQFGGAPPSGIGILSDSVARLLEPFTLPAPHVTQARKVGAY
jgi:hypothetical protein